MIDSEQKSNTTSHLPSHRRTIEERINISLSSAFSEASCAHMIDEGSTQFFVSAKFRSGRHIVGFKQTTAFHSTHRSLTLTPQKGGVLMPRQQRMMRGEAPTSLLISTSTKRYALIALAFSFLVASLRCVSPQLCRRQLISWVHTFKPYAQKNIDSFGAFFSKRSSSWSSAVVCTLQAAHGATLCSAHGK